MDGKNMIFQIDPGKDNRHKYWTNGDWICMKRYEKKYRK